MFKRSDRLGAIGLSEIVQISEAASRMRREGQDILALSTGEPDFPTPSPICEAATAAMAAGHTRYTATAGSPELRSAVADFCGFDTGAENVIISTGAKQVLFNAFMATLNEGDEVIIPTPYWASYRDIVSVAGGNTVEIKCGIDAGFKLTAENLEAAITHKTRWLLLNTPSNPSGAMYSHDELTEIGHVLERYPDVWVMSDEIYQYIAYAPFASFRLANPALANRTLIVNGVSKAWSMTGWRIGWGIGPQELIKAMVAVQGQNTSGASSISQAAAVAALEGDQSHLEERRTIFLKRRNMVVEKINDISLLTCPVPEGAFYVFPSCIETFGRRTAEGAVIQTDADFCHHVLKSVGLAIVPGRAFSMPGHFRLSYAYAEDELEEGSRRLRRAVDLLVD